MENEAIPVADWSRWPRVSSRNPTRRAPGRSSLAMPARNTWNDHEAPRRLLSVQFQADRLLRSLPAAAIELRKFRAHGEHALHAQSFLARLHRADCGLDDAREIRPLARHRSGSEVRTGALAGAFPQ